jgi:hypothetical protein
VWWVAREKKTNKVSLANSWKSPEPRIPLRVAIITYYDLHCKLATDIAWNLKKTWCLNHTIYRKANTV